MRFRPHEGHVRMKEQSDLRKKKNAMVVNKKRGKGANKGKGERSVPKELKEEGERICKGEHSTGRRVCMGMKWFRNGCRPCSR